MTLPSYTRVAEKAFESSIYGFYEKGTGTWQYLVADERSREGALIDPVLDFDPASGNISTATADGLLAFADKGGYKIRRVLETHAHADHLTAAQYIKRHLGGSVSVGIGERITKVQETFKKIYALDDLQTDGSQFDDLWKDDQVFKLGDLDTLVIPLPGHTPDHVGYLIGDSVFVGDSLFMPDTGTARADFPGGSAGDLYSAAQRLLSLPAHFKIYVGHDYPPSPRTEPQCVATVAEHKDHNKYLKMGTDREQFLKLRNERDSKLGAPRLLHPSLQVNLRAGHLPEPDKEGRRFLKLPVRLPVNL
ncbi:beta-lactamase-like protein [Phlyctochytrium arcticum]|nr:beta-lactamase-like protein [Phlyctochytrium arcticum]